MILSPGELSCQTSCRLFVEGDEARRFRLRHRLVDLGGPGWPLPVTTNTLSPSTSGEQKATACRTTFSFFIMSYCHTIRPFAPSPFVSAQITSPAGVT